MALVMTETILIKPLPGLDVPETGGIGGDVIGHGQSPVREMAELDFEVHQANSYRLENREQGVVHLAGQPVDFPKVLFTDDI